MSARVLALWSPDWPVTAAAREAHVPAHRPAAVFVANRVLACSAVARSQGIRRGLRRREAQARCPDLAVLAPDPDRDARAFEPVVLAVEELAPGVEVVRPGLVVLAARGPVGYFGGELAAAERLVDQVAARTGVECQAGFADGLFAAVLAARRGLAVAPGDTPAFLAPLGVAELDREPDVDRSELVGLLDRLGLRSLGAFASLDVEDVATRFGADAVLCHRLARGLDPRPPVRRRPPEELTVEIELDPPVDRVDAAAFAARGLAERLHRTLADHGLSCTRLGVAARTVAGEELLRVWRCAEPLTPSGTVDRVRWQLDSWLARGNAGAVDRLWLVPEETVTAGALQLGLWGEVGEADERAGRALVRVQALLGPDAVVTAVLTGGRNPAEQVRLVPWGDAREDGAVAGTVIDASGPGGVGSAATGPRTSIMEGYRVGSGAVIGGSGPGAVDTAAVGPQPLIMGEASWPGVVIGASGPGAADTAPDGPQSSIMGGHPPDPGAMITASGPGAADTTAAGPQSSIMGEASCPGAVIGGSGPGAADTTADGPQSSIMGGHPLDPGAVITASGPGAADTPAPGPQSSIMGAAPASPIPHRTAPAPESPPPPFTGAGLVGAGPDSLVGRTSRPAPPRSTARRRAPTRGSTRTGTVRETPPSWPGRLPAPSPATVPPQPLPAELVDADGRPVLLVESDRLSAAPRRLVVDGGGARTVAGWAGPWPVLQRWWAPDADESSRVQVLGEDGVAFLLVARDGRWWVVGVYD